MDSKNLTLRIVAFIIAIGSAYSSSMGIFEESSAYIRVKFDGDSEFRCLNTGKKCDNLHGTTCLFEIKIIGSGLPGIMTVPGRKLELNGTTCSVQYKGRSHDLSDHTFLDAK